VDLLSALISGRRHLAVAEELAAAVGSAGNRAVIDGELAREQWFGLK
jgi:hypothetical protein